MKEKKIEHIAYQLKQNRKNNQQGAIVLIGAGCSVSANIPAASEIVKYVMNNHKDNPDIKGLSDLATYAELMECLGPVERKIIFKHYVDKAKINVSHIYLAHLMINEYVDYIVTVNFDNLAQRALALYNMFPPTYDISILKDLTTTKLEEKSITYLHGQYNGLWQLNTKEEMRKVIDSDIAKDIFHKNTDNRLWIIVGYSGEDFIFDQLVKLGRFDNGLYWVGYKDQEPTKRVREELLDKTNTESFWIKGYDSDSFFLKLNSELKNEDPKIFNYPFSFLLELQESIKDIDESEDYKSVKERLIQSKKNVQDAINRYEKIERNEPQMSVEEIEHGQLSNALINCLISEKYEDLASLENQVKENEYVDLLPLVSDIYYNWGTNLGNLAETKSGIEAEDLYLQSFDKFRKTVKIKPDYNDAYYNWGTNLGNLAKTKSGVEAEDLYLQSFEKFSKAVEIKPDYNDAYYNWGTNLGNLAKTKSGVEAEDLYLQSFAKFSKTVEIKPEYYQAYYNWGTYLGNFAQTKSGAEAEDLYLQSFEKFSKAVEIKPEYYQAYYNWGTYLGNLAQTKSGAEAEDLYLQSFEKFSKAVEIKPDYNDAYYNWGTYLGNLAQTKSGVEAEALYLRSFEKFSKAVEINPNYDDAYYNWGTNLGNFAQTKSGAEAEDLYLQSFEKFSKAVEIKPEYNQAYHNWGTYLGNLAQTKSGVEAEALYLQSFEKFSKAVEINPNYYDAYYNWGTNLGNLAQTKSGPEAKELYLQSFDKFSKTVEIKPDYYDAYFNWGTYLGNLAQIKSGAEAEELYMESFEKFSKVTEIKPDFQDAYYNWGAYLINLSKTKSGEEAKVLHLQAFDKLKKAVDLGGSSYNLACLNAVTKNSEEAFRVLETSLQKNEITFEIVEEDSNWDNLRKEPQYEKLKNLYSK